MDLVFVNYKNIHDRPSLHVPQLEDLMEELYINTMACFGDEAMDETDYTVRIVDYLHNDLEHVSSPPRKKSCKVHHVTFRNEHFKVKRCGSLHAMQNRWELFTLLTHDKNNSKFGIGASCLVHFNDIYASCEIHEVCVGTAGKGYCKELLKRVRDHISNGHSGNVAEIRIFCENGNIAACKCYTSVFVKARMVSSVGVTGYIYPIQKTKSVGGKRISK